MAAPQECARSKTDNAEVEVGGQDPSGFIAPPAAFSLTLRKQLNLRTTIPSLFAFLAGLVCGWLILGASDRTGSEATQPNPKDAFYGSILLSTLKTIGKGKQDHSTRLLDIGLLEALFSLKTQYEESSEGKDRREILARLEDMIAFVKRHPKRFEDQQLVGASEQEIIDSVNKGTPINKTIDDKRTTSQWKQRFLDLYAWYETETAKTEASSTAP